MTRLRDLGYILGRYEPGPNNAITDVASVSVGHTTLKLGDAGPLVQGQGPVRTGVTAVLAKGGNAFMDRVAAGAFVLNGAGELSGITQVQEWGVIESPIMLTNTLSVGRVADATVKYLVERFPSIGNIHDVVIPVVGECDDSWLNDAAGGHIQEHHVYGALNSAAGGPVAEGNVGAGTGMVTCDFAGGIGTSSRKLPENEDGFTVGVLVLSNFGHMDDLRLDGLPLGKILASRYKDMEQRRRAYGSIIAVLATDAPLSTHQLTRVSKRVALGIGRAGSYAAHHSGEIVISFSTANTFSRDREGTYNTFSMLRDKYIDPIYRAAVEATEEAILNAIFAAEPVSGVDNHMAPALPLDITETIIKQFNEVSKTMSRYDVNK